MNKDFKNENNFDGRLPDDNEQLTDEELDLLRQSIDSQRIDRSTLPPHDNSGKARAIRYAKKNVIFVSVIAVCIVCVAVILTLAVVFSIRNARSAPNTDDFLIEAGEETYVEEYDFAMRKGMLYIDMRKVAKVGELIVGGGKNTASFSTPNGHYLSFENGSEIAMVNGNKVSIGGMAEVSDTVCMVPYDFLSSVLDSDNNGLRVSYNSVDNIVEIKRRYSKVDGEQIFLDISFNLDDFEVITDPIDPDTLYKYSIDISPYLDSIKSEHLLLVNKQKENYLGSAYVPSDLVKLTCQTREPLREWEFQLCSDAANALYAMLLEMEAEGFTDIKVTSAYRPYSYQETLFNNYVAEYKREEGMSQAEAEAQAEKTSARPGASEHQSGLCVDFVTEDHPTLTEAFENSDAFKWLSNNAYKFGFILRYPREKEAITGYSYEPWHYRFVGRQAATEIYESGLSLEEYVQNSSINN